MFFKLYKWCQIAQSNTYSFWSFSYCLISLLWRTFFRNLFNFLIRNHCPRNFVLRILYLHHICPASKTTFSACLTSLTTLRKKCPYSELLWFVFSCIRTEYGKIRSISPYSVRMRENADQNNSKYGHFSRRVNPKNDNINS